MTEMPQSQPQPKPRRWLVPVAALVLTVLGLVSLGLGYAAGATPASVATVDSSRPAPSASLAASALRTCSVAELATDSRLGTMSAMVRLASTGEVLFDRNGNQASRPASVQKILTSAAALATLGPDYRATTTVVRGANPGEIVLVGGGDLTLARDGSNVYPGAASLPDLASTALAAYQAATGSSPSTLVLDSSYFSGEEWQSSWNWKELGDGYQAPVSALMVDGGRENPSANVSSRSDDPVGQAGEAFASLLGGGLTITRGTAPAGAQKLASVESPTVAQLIDKALTVSDNTAAEMLARLVAIKTGAGNSFAAIQSGVVGALASYGIDTTGITMVDGSGLSDNNAVSPAYLTELFRKINAREGNLGIIVDSLPISGERGSLSYSDRFSGDNAEADGAVYAKTGWIDTGYTLSGIIHAADGTDLTFAIFALDDVDDSAKQAIDTWVTGVYRCGNQLANF